MANEVCYAINPLVLQEDDHFRNEELELIEKHLQDLQMISMPQLEEKSKRNLLARYYYSVLNFSCYTNNKFIREMTLLANEGVVAAGITLGDLYSKGLNLDLDVGKAIESYLLSAKLGSSTAFLRLGQLYALSASEEGALKRAKYYFQKSESIGDAKGAFNLGILLVTKESNIEEGILSFKKAAKSGHGRAAFNLYILLTDSTSPYFDNEEAMTNLKIASEAGVVEAHYRLGLHYLENNANSLETGLSLLKKAANSEYVPAQEALGVHYSKNISSLKQFEKAEKWMQKAALNGSEASYGNLMTLYESFKSVVSDTDLRKSNWIAHYNSMLSKSSKQKQK